MASNDTLNPPQGGNGAVQGGTMSAEEANRLRQELADSRRQAEESRRALEESQRRGETTSRQLDDYFAERLEGRGGGRGRSAFVAIGASAGSQGLLVEMFKDSGAPIPADILMIALSKKVMPPAQLVSTTANLLAAQGRRSLILVDGKGEMSFTSIYDRVRRLPMSEADFHSGLINFARLWSIKGIELPEASEAWMTHYSDCVARIAPGTFPAVAEYHNLKFTQFHTIQTAARENTIATFDAAKWDQALFEEAAANVGVDMTNGRFSRTILEHTKARRSVLDQALMSVKFDTGAVGAAQVGVATVTAMQTYTAMTPPASPYKRASEAAQPFRPAPADRPQRASPGCCVVCGTAGPPPGHRSTECPTPPAHLERVVNHRGGVALVIKPGNYDAGKNVCIAAQFGNCGYANCGYSHACALCNNGQHGSVPGTLNGACGVGLSASRDQLAAAVGANGSGR